MSQKVLIVPDKFKGTLTAQAAARAMADGWKKSRPQDQVELLPMSDGGDGFGTVLSDLLNAKVQTITTVDAAHRPLCAQWWWEPKTKTAIIESARVIGLAMLPAKKFHPFQLDTFGLGAVLQAAQKKGATKCLIGIGGSATNDGGFGLACALGWKFSGRFGDPIREWWQLEHVAKILPPENKFAMQITVAVDVSNPLLGPKGCSRIYGPQKGLRPEDFVWAEKNLGRMADVLKEQLKINHAAVPGSGAAGGLGFGLMSFADGKTESGFEIFSKAAHLENRIRVSDLVITGEGAMDQQTYMGKGVGQVAVLCKKAKIPCIGLAGVVLEPHKAGKLFSQAHGLVEITTEKNAKKHPARYLEKLAHKAAAALIVEY